MLKKIIAVSIFVLSMSSALVFATVDPNDPLSQSDMLCDYQNTNAFCGGPAKSDGSTANQKSCFEYVALKGYQILMFNTDPATPDWRYWGIEYESISQAPVSTICGYEASKCQQKGYKDCYNASNPSDLTTVYGRCYKYNSQFKNVCMASSGLHK